MQPCINGDQPYSDASPNGECSLSSDISAILLSVPSYPSRFIQIKLYMNF